MLTNFVAVHKLSAELECVLPIFLATSRSLNHEHKFLFIYFSKITLNVRLDAFGTRVAPHNCDNNFQRFNNANSTIPALPLFQFRAAD